MNTDERRAVKILHEKYPDYEVMLADFIDWLRQRNRDGQKFSKPYEIASEFEKSEFFKKDSKNGQQKES